MKKSIKQFLSCIVVIMLTVIGIKYIGYRLDPAWSQDGFDVIDAFHSLEDNSLDVIVYGSSHAWKGFDTSVLNDKYGIPAYNYGCNWQAFNTTLLFLQDSLVTQSPKAVVIDTGKVNTILKNSNMDGQVYYSRKIPMSMDKLYYVVTCLGKKVDGKHIERYASYFLPLIMFHENWNIINGENYLKQGYQRFVDSTGFFGNYDVYATSIPDYSTFEQRELNEDSKKMLGEMVKACQEKNVDVIFYTCPWAGEYHYGEAMKKFAEENGCDYIDLFEHLDEAGIDGSTDLADAKHLNAYGAAKVADYIGNYISEKYGYK